MGQGRTPPRDLAPDLGRMAAIVEDARVDWFVEGNVRSAAERLLEALESMVEAADRQRQVGGGT